MNASIATVLIVAVSVWAFLRFVRSVLKRSAFAGSIAALSGIWLYCVPFLVELLRFVLPVRSFR